MTKEGVRDNLRPGWQAPGLEKHVMGGRGTGERMGEGVGLEMEMTGKAGS